MLLHQTLLTLALIVRGSASYHVLFNHNWGTKSHLIQVAPMMEGLLDKGHEVTAIVFSTLKIQACPSGCTIILFNVKTKVLSQFYHSSIKCKKKVENLVV